MEGSGFERLHYWFWWRFVVTLLATQRLSNLFRVNLSLGAAAVCGFWSFGRSVESCIERILSLEDSRIQRELANMQWLFAFNLERSSFAVCIFGTFLEILFLILRVHSCGGDETDSKKNDAEETTVAHKQDYAMRVHPMATKRKVAIRDGPDFNSIQMERNAHKKLKKLPHVFSKVLEMPFNSDAEVVVEEGPDSFRFVTEIKVDSDEDGTCDVRAHAVEIHPGIIKIVVRKNGRDDVELALDKLEVDTWRFRLPSGSLPELATASFVDGELIVTVPKGGGRREFVDGRDDWGNESQLVLVQ